MVRAKTPGLWSTSSTHSMAPSMFFRSFNWVTSVAFLRTLACRRWPCLCICSGSVLRGSHCPLGHTVHHDGWINWSSRSLFVNSFILKAVHTLSDIFLSSSALHLILHIVCLTAPIGAGPDHPCFCIYVASQYEHQYQPPHWGMCPHHAFLHLNQG